MTDDPIRDQADDLVFFKGIPAVGKADINALPMNHHLWSKPLLHNESVNGLSICPVNFTNFHRLPFIAIFVMLKDTVS